MAYISYTDVPLYFNKTLGNGATLPGVGDNNSRGVYCQQVQLNYTPNISPVRLVGKTPTKDSFNLAGAPNSSLSFSAYLESGNDGNSGHFNPADYTRQVGNVGDSFVLGDEENGISGSGAFLTSFSYTITPYAPVLMQCDFAIYNPLTTVSTGGQISAETSETMLPTLDFGKYGHGVYSTFSGVDQPATTTLSDIDVFESISYQFSASRLPIYKVGSYYLDAQELITAEQTLQIQ